MRWCDALRVDDGMRSASDLRFCPDDAFDESLIQVLAGFSGGLGADDGG